MSGGNMEIVRKTLSRQEWYSDAERRFEHRMVSEPEFEGAVGLITFTDIKKPFMIHSSKGDFCIADRGYQWLEVVPKDGHWALTAMFHEDGELFQQYFDITQKNDVTEDGDAAFYDMFLDVVVAGRQKPVLLDAEELTQAFQIGILTIKEYEMAKEQAEKIVEAYLDHREKIEETLKRYREMF